MFEIHNYYDFVAAIFVFQLFPGAGTVVILSATATNGLKAGMAAVCGTITGDCIYMASAVLGLAAILGAHPMVFAATQYLGVLYLLYLGLRYLFMNVKSRAIDETITHTSWIHFKQALAVCLTNPKAIMFFLAFFPLFLKADSKPTTLLTMMLHVTFISLFYQTLLVFVGRAITNYISREKYIKIVAARLIGLAFIGFSLRLAKNINY